MLRNIMDMDYFTNDFTTVSVLSPLSHGTCVEDPTWSPARLALASELRDTSKCGHTAQYQGSVCTKVRPHEDIGRREPCGSQGERL